MDQNDDRGESKADPLTSEAGKTRYGQLAPGHPVETFLRENAAVLEQVRHVRDALAEFLKRPDDAQAAAALPPLRQAVGNLRQVEKHYLRKEGLLFPRLERYGITAPSTIMWGRDDDVRGQLLMMQRHLADADVDARRLAQIAEATVEPALQEVERLVRQEEKQLLPMAWETLSEDDWGDIWRDSPQFGWCLIEPRDGYQPPTPEPRVEDSDTGHRPVLLPTGSVTPEQLQFLFATLPLDLTFVDADDRIRFYSLGPEPIFARVKTDLGRKVQDCHLPQTIRWVNRILADFRAGRLNVVDSWIDHEDRFVHVRYFAVRDATGRYLGTLEMVQDVTAIQQLKGACRLAQYPDHQRTESEDESR